MTATESNQFNYQTFNTAIWDTSLIWTGDANFRQIDIGDKIKGPNDDTTRIFTVQSGSIRMVLLFTDISTSPPMQWRCDTIELSLQSYFSARIGDVDRDGDNDLVMARSASPYYLYRYYWTGTTWAKDSIAIGGANWGMDIGDADNDGYDDDVVYGAGLGVNSRLCRAQRIGAVWSVDTLWQGDGRNILGVAIGNFDSANGDSNEIVAVTMGDTPNGGRVMRIRWSGSGWDTLTLWKAPDNALFTEPAIGDFDASNPGNEIAVANGLNTGALVHGAVIEIYGSGNSWSHRPILMPTGPISTWGVAVGDVINTHPGDEVVCSHYSPPYLLRAIYGSGNNWAHDTIFDIGGLSYSVAIGNVNKHRNLNQEIVLTGNQRVFAAEQMLPVKDVGITKIIAPTGNIDSGSVITPACSIYNYGNLTASYSVRMKISNSYNSIATVNGHAPGTGIYLNNFPAWTAYQTGFHMVSCSTELADDDSTYNDKKLDTIFVWVRDVGTEMILNPVSGSVFSPGSMITPQARLRNYGNVTETFTAEFKLEGPTTYSDIQTINGLLPNNYIDQNFIQSDYLDAGFYTMSCSTSLSGDMNNINDQQTNNFLVMAEPLLLLPTSYGMINDNTPLFDWEDLAGADYYWIQVDNDSNFSSTEFENSNVIASQIEVTTPFGDGVYYWHIRGGAGGLWGPWSDVWQFELDATAPNAPLLVSPDSTASDVDLNPTFVWTPVSFTSNFSLVENKTEVDFPIVDYELQLSTDSNFSTKTLDTLVSTTSITCPITLNYSTLYFWQVRAIDEASNIGPFSSRFEFITRPPPPTAWNKMADIPIGISGRKPKSGSCMAGLDGKIYFLKASNTQDFYVYTPDMGLGTWSDAEPIPIGTKEDGDGKKPKKGAAMTAYQGALYVLRGKNTVGFWKYQTDTTGQPIGWYKLANIPTGLKKPKYGSGLVTVTKQGNAYIFAMKGSKTSEFYLYDIAENSWIHVSSPPVGTSGRLGYKKGSCLAYDGDEFVYVLQGYYGSFFKYNVEADSWIQLRQYNYKTFLNRDGKKKKPKDGAGLVYHNNSIYLLKGGNTYEFWTYEIALDTWIQMEPAELWDIPVGSGRKVKGGGCLTLLDTDLYVAKGSNTIEFYKHNVIGFEAARITAKAKGTMSYRTAIGEFKLTIVPNPAINITTVRYNLPKPGPVCIKFYDITGKLIKTYIKEQSSKNGEFLINLKTQPSGVYILQFNSGTAKITKKLVLEK